MDMTLRGMSSLPGIARAANLVSKNHKQEGYVCRRLVYRQAQRRLLHPGSVFKLSPKVTGYAGYSIGNQNTSQGNHFFLLELGYNFN